MKSLNSTQNTKATNFFRTLLIAAASLMLFAASTENAKAQDPAVELVTALDPLLQALINSNIVDILDVPANPTPQEIADLVNQGISDVLAFLNGGPVPPGADPNQFLGDLENILGGSETSINNLFTFLDSNAIPGDGGALLDPVREVLADVFELLLTVDDDVVLPAPLDDLSLDELLAALQSIIDNPNLQTTLENLLTTILTGPGGLDLPTVTALLLGGITDLVTQLTTTTTEVITFLNPPPEDPPPPPESPRNAERPDAIVGKRLFNGKGNDIYGSGGGQIFNGTHKTRTLSGTRIHFFVLQNDGLVTSTYNSRGNSKNRFIRIKIFNNNQNVTAALMTGNQKNTIPAGSRTNFTIRSKAKGNLRARGNSGRVFKNRAAARIRLHTTAPDGANNESDRAILILKAKG